MKSTNTTLRLITAALLAAFTCVATMVIQIPTTATGGYIHIGDTFVILSGIILGPILGGLSAGLGSLLADGLSGYAIYMIPTFLIKFTAAFLCGVIYRKLQGLNKKSFYIAFIPASIVSELTVILGYFLNSILLFAILNTSMSRETIGGGISSGILGLLPNAIQGLAGIILAFALLPILFQIPTIRTFVETNKK